METINEKQFRSDMSRKFFSMTPPNRLVESL